MPYFIEQRDEKYCVVQGTKKKPGDTEECHDTKDEASAHMRALYANVEDADKATTAPSSTANLPHGTGGMFSLGQALGDEENGEKAVSCVCPECGHKVPKKLREPCNEIKCPECGAMMRLDTGESEKAESPGASKFISYKDASGAWRWLSISNVAIQDREGEIVSEKAYDDAIALARSKDAFGELDLVHVPHTDVGDADFMARLGNELVEGGAWRDDPGAIKARETVQARPDDWGVSIMFKYDPSQFDGTTYAGGIRILKRSILPRGMAASHGTAIAVVGGDAVKEFKMTKEVKEALAALGVAPEKIAELAEKAKSVPQEENVVIKEDEKQSLWQRLGQLLGVTKSVDPDETAPPAVVESDEVEPEASKTEDQDRPEAVAKPAPELTLSEDAAKAIGEQAAQVLAGTVESAVAPLRDELETVKAKLAEAEQRMAGTEQRLAEAEKSVEVKVNERLASLPPVVTVRTTEVAATEAPGQPQAAKDVKNPTANFVAAVQDLVNRGLKSGDLKIEI